MKELAHIVNYILLHGDNKRMERCWFPHEPGRGVFVSNKYKKAVEEHERTGFKFSLTQDSDGTR